MKKLITFILFTISINLFAASDIEIQNPIIRLAPPGMNITAAFLKVINHTKQDIKILKVIGDFAKNYELHNMDMIEGRMQMRPVDSIEVKANSFTELKSGGLHIMIFDVKKPMKIGDQYKLKLILDNKKEIEFIGKVK